MDEKFLGEWATKLNIKEEDLKKQFEDAKAEMQSHFPNQAPETIFEKAKMKLKVDHKRQFMSREVSFVGIVIGAGNPKDNLVKIRATQVDTYNEAKKQEAKTGDSTTVKKILDNKVVQIEEDGSITPLWPKFKKDGSPNKLAGTEMPTPKEWQSQNVFIVGTPFEKTEVKGIILELKGEICNQEMHQGQIVTFKGINKTQEGSTVYNLTSNRTEFLKTESEYLQEGLNKFGITGLISKFFADYIVDWSTVKEWIAALKKDPKSFPIPEKNRWDLMVLLDGMCIDLNLTPNAKGNVKANVCGTSDDLEDLTGLCIMPKRLDPTIDFAANSKVVTLGTPWLPIDKDTGEINFNIMTVGMYAYPDWKIPRVDTKKLSEKELQQSVVAPKVEEPKKEEPKSEPKAKPEPKVEPKAEPKVEMAVPEMKRDDPEPEPEKPKQVSTPKESTTTGTPSNTTKPTTTAAGKDPW